MSMPEQLQRLHGVIEAIVFGNGWLALGGLGAVVLVVVLVRLFPPLRV